YSTATFYYDPTRFIKALLNQLIFHRELSKIFLCYELGNLFQDLLTNLCLYQTSDWQVNLPSLKFRQVKLKKYLREDWGRELGEQLFFDTFDNNKMTYFIKHYKR
ncbi:MAG: hypothetical protein WBV81_20740, partial [Ignavibacteriaceae bacterium]